MSALVRIGVAIVGGAIVTAGGLVVAGPPAPAPFDPLGPEAVTVGVDVENSRFIPASMTVETGTEVHFVLRNGDPIGHELIVGPSAVHERHRHGTEPAHEPRDGELSVGPDGQGVTTYVFDEPGRVEMACHLPGHYEFGMHGEIEVVDP